MLSFTRSALVFLTIFAAVCSQSDGKRRFKPRAYKVDARIIRTNWAPYKTYPNRVVQTLYPGTTRNLTQALMRDGLFRQLTPREPVIEVIYPEEVEVFKKVNITIEDLNKIAINNYIQYTPLDLGCLGKAQVRGGELAYIEAIAGNYENLRAEAEQLFLDKGGKKGEFSATPFFPHVTVATSFSFYVPESKVVQGPCLANITHEDPFTAEP